MLRRNLLLLDAFELLLGENNDGRPAPAITDTNYTSCRRLKDAPLVARGNYRYPFRGMDMEGNGWPHVLHYLIKELNMEPGDSWHLKVVRFLLFRGAHVDVKSSILIPPLIVVAAHKGYANSMKMRTEKNADQCTDDESSVAHLHSIETEVKQMNWNVSDSKGDMNSRATKVDILEFLRSIAPACPTMSKMNTELVDPDELVEAFRCWIRPLDAPLFKATFESCVKPIDISQVSRQNSYEQYMGAPLQQLVPGTCAIISSTSCVEIQHRVLYEREHGDGTFPYIAAAPRKLRSACRRRGIWTCQYGAYVGKVLGMMQIMGGARTTNAPTPAPCFLPLRSFERRSWPTAKQIAYLIDQQGPLIGTVWVNPWYHAFDSSKKNDWVYRSGCARNSLQQRSSEATFGLWFEIGFHSVLCFAYRVCDGDFHVHIWDNYTRTGPKRWVHYKELEFVYTVCVERMHPPFHLDGRQVVYPPSRRKAV